MTINYDNIHLAIAALNQCAKENENRQTDTGAVRVSDLCTDVAYFLCKVRQDHKQWQETKDGRKFQFGPSRDNGKAIRILDQNGNAQYLTTICFYN